MNKLGLALFVALLLISPVFAYNSECNTFGDETNQKLKNLQTNCAKQDKTICEMRAFSDLYYNIVEDENNWDCFNSQTNLNKELFSELYVETLGVYDKLIEEKKDSGRIGDAISLLEKEYLYLKRCERYEDILEKDGFCKRREMIKEEYQKLLINTNNKVRDELNEDKSKATCQNYYELLKKYSAKLSGIDLERLEKGEHSELPIRFPDAEIEYKKNAFSDSIYCGYLCKEDNAWNIEPSLGIECYNTSRKILTDLGSYNSETRWGLNYDEVLYGIDKNLVSLAEKKGNAAEIIKYHDLAGESAFSTVVEEGCKEFAVHCIAQYILDLKELDKDTLQEKLARLEESKNYYSKGDKEQRKRAVFIYHYQTTKELRKKIYLGRMNNEMFETVYDMLEASILLYLLAVGASIIIAIILYYAPSKINGPIQFNFKAPLKAKDTVMLIASLWVGTSIAFGLAMQTETSAMQTFSSGDVEMINYFLETPEIQQAIDFSIVFSNAWMLLTLSLVFGLLWMYIPETNFSDSFIIPTIGLLIFSILAITSFLFYIFCAILTMLVIIGSSMVAPILSLKLKMKKKAEQSRKKFVLNQKSKKLHVSTCRYAKKPENNKSLNLSTKELEKYDTCKICIKK